MTGESIYTGAIFACDTSTCIGQITLVVLFASLTQHRVLKTTKRVHVREACMVVSNCACFPVKVVQQHSSPTQKYIVHTIYCNILSTIYCIVVVNNTNILHCSSIVLVDKKVFNQTELSLIYIRVKPHQSCIVQ